MNAARVRQAHRCRPGGKPVGELGTDRPGWGEPGQLTKLEGEERWGRVAYLMRCCGERLVEFVRQDGSCETETERLWLRDLVNPYGAHPFNLPPPRGYLTPKRGGRGVVPFGGERG